MTNNQRDELLISVAKGLNNLQITVNEMQRNMATKEDLKRFATKEDLKRFATKEDLKRFATKEDLKRFATKEDIKDMVRKQDIEDMVRKQDIEDMVRRKDLKGFVTKEYLDERLDEQTKLIAKDTADVIKIYVEQLREVDKKNEKRLDEHDKEINQIKLLIANKKY